MKNIIHWSCTLAGIIITSSLLLGDSNKDLVSAIKRRDNNGVIGALNKGADVNKADDDEITPLHDAVMSGNYDTVKLLLDRDANVNAKTSVDMTPLHLAILHKRNNIIPLLLSRGARANATYKSGFGETAVIESALQLALRQGDIETLLLLLSYGARYDKQTLGGLLSLPTLPPLIKALFKKDKADIAMLVQHADSKDLETALKVAAGQRMIDEVKLLITLLREREIFIDGSAFKEIMHALKILIDRYSTKWLSGDKVEGYKQIEVLLSRFMVYNNAVREQSSPVLDFLAIADDLPIEISQNISLGSTEVIDTTASGRLLRAALVNHDNDVVKALKEGANPIVHDVNKRTALHYAAFYGNLVIIKNLIVRQPNLVNYRDSLGRTPLHYAAEQGNMDAVQLLMFHGSNQDTRDSEGLTPAQVMLRSGRVPTKQVPLEFDRDVRLRMAANKNNKEALKRALEQKANSNDQDIYGMSALHYAVIKASSEIISALLDAKADPIIQDKNGNTPLHYAARRGDRKIVELLLRAGARNNIRNSHGHTPDQLALQSGHSDIAGLLISFRPPSLLSRIFGAVAGTGGSGG